ncbi:class I poly(R)-hydroxyalkanoic acid synthase [Variovorax sp. KK3]|uniref:class I poly(R)-hydroxyalkanoic acid synthase n=1 Tax=Variovorax sp. KK3 TaxID=1855728 RepID=UPI00097CB3AF|nr:class I poly(R)-hydroxyalkanoic acid synthase [Variovorax sp. KK3]
MSAPLPPSVPDLGRWISDLFDAQQAMLRSFGAAPEPPPASADAEPVPLSLMAAARTLSAWQEETLRQVAAIWPVGEPADAADAADRRFAGQAWREDPRFDLAVRHYQSYAKLLRGAIDEAPADAQQKAQWHFALRQVLDALSPANCLATNPEAMRAAVDSGGASLVEGMRLFLQDLARGRISMTDETAFEVGRNVATSPGSVVFENELMQLIQYAPSTAKVFERPLLIVPPCINKFYILDLQPANSLVAHAVSQGHTVFLVSWRNVSQAQGHLGWDDYVEEGVIAAIDVAREIADAERIDALGFCVGGTLLACALAVLAARGEQKAASLTLLTTMLDFHDPGEIGMLVNEPMLALREAAIGGGGVLHGRELAQVFASLRANDLIWPYVVNGYLKGKAPPAFDLLFWNSDDANLPGPMFCWYLRNCYLENRLRVPGGTVQCGESVDFGRIDVPSFIYASRDDHIVPWRTAYASTRLLGGDVRFVLGASGHIAGVINAPAARKRNHWVGEVGPEPQRWLDAAESVPGSWWPEWTRWLATHAGAQVAAPKKAGSRAHPVIEPAPGRYVREQAT